MPMEKLLADLQFVLPNQKIQIEQETDRLYILLESNPIPSISETLRSIAPILQTLDRNQDCYIYGRESGDRFTSWQRKFYPRPLTDRPFDATLRTPEVIEASAEEYIQIERIIICGLGSLGQHCLNALKRFSSDDLEVKVTAIDRYALEDCEFEDIISQLERPLILGDCRRDQFLEAAGIHDCQAILIVTSDDRTNIETAIAARRLNPTANIIVKSGQKNLNELLKTKLGNFIPLDPIELPASTLTLAALSETLLGIFNIANYRLTIIRHRIENAQDNFYGIPLDRIQHHRKDQRLLSYIPANQVDRPMSIVKKNVKKSRVFHQWQPDRRIEIGDEIIFIEAHDTSLQSSPIRSRTLTFKFPKELIKKLFSHHAWIGKIQKTWEWINQNNTRKVITFGLLLGLLLGAIGTVTLKLSGATESWRVALSSSVVLLLGGYGDVFAGLDEPKVPAWVQLLCFLITAFSLLFVLSVLGLAADSLLSSKFDFLKRRIPVPDADHVVIVGVGRVAQQIVSVLQELKQPFVLLANQTEDQTSIEIQNAPIVYSAIGPGLRNVNLDRAKSAILATDDQMLNLEAALMSRDVAYLHNPTLNLVIRTNDQSFSQQLNSLLPDARTFCVYALSAEAFVGAAFGENILSLFRLEDATVLVTEFLVNEGDTLKGKLISEICYGYGVVAIYHSSSQGTTPQLMPSDETIVKVGDRIVVLATINGIRRIEQGSLKPKQHWQLQVCRPLDQRSVHYAGDTLTNVTGCNLSTSRTFMNNLPTVLGLPGVLELELYDHQAYRLEQKLRKLLPTRLICLD